MSEFPSHHDFGVFALEENKIPPAAPPKFSGKVGMCGNKTRGKKQTITKINGEIAYE